MDSSSFSTFDQLQVEKVLDAIANLSYDSWVGLWFLNHPLVASEKHAREDILWICDWLARYRDLPITPDTLQRIIPLVRAAYGLLGI